MGKKILVILFSLFLFIGVSNFQTVKASSTYSPSDVPSGIGYGIDLGKANGINASQIKTGQRIFTGTGFANKISNMNIIVDNYTEVSSITSKDIKEIQAQMAYKLGINVSAGIPVVMPKIGEINYGISASSYHKNYLDNYYYLLNQKNVSYYASLPDYMNYTDYGNIVTAEFVNDFMYATTTSSYLTQAQIDSRYESFFNKYGTHLLTKGEYGSTLELYHNVANNKIDVAATFGIQMNQEMNAIIEGVQIGAQEKIDLNFIFSEAQATYKETFSVKTRGGSFFSAMSKSGLENNYQNWLDSVNSETFQPVLIGTADNGLIPIAYYIPNNVIYNGKQNLTAKRKIAMNAAMTKYINKCASELVLNYTFSGNEIIKDYSRASIYTINEGSISNNPKDEIRYEYGYSTLYNQGFRNVQITVSFYAREEDDGYQEVYLYDSQDRLYEAKCFEHGPGFASGTPARYSFTFNTNLSIFDNTNSIRIRYGAHGWWDDTWFNQNANIQIKIYK